MHNSWTQLSDNDEVAGRELGSSNKMMLGQKEKEKKVPSWNFFCFSFWNFQQDDVGSKKKKVEKVPTRAPTQFSSVAAPIHYRLRSIKSTRLRS